MALTLADRIKQYTTSTGTGDVSFTGTPAGFATFGSALTNGDVTYYCIEENDKWEVGIGTYGSDNMVRSYVLDSSNSGSRIDLGGSGTVFVTYPADKSVYRDQESRVVVGPSGLVFDNGATFKEPKLTELTDVSTSGTIASTHVLALNNTNKSLLLGDLTGPSNSNNTLIGYGAGSGITSATNNVAIGTDAGIANTAGIKNVNIGTLSGPSEVVYANPASYVVSIGHEAGSRAKSSVTAIGYRAGMAAYETGFVAVGAEAGYGIGGYSVGVGKEAAHGMVSDYVVAVGHQAAKSAAGVSSVWIGNMAGISATSSNLCVGIGFQAGKESSATDSIYIGANVGRDNSDDDYLYIGNGSPSSNRTLIKGDMQSKRLAVGAADVTLEDTFYIGIASSADKGLVVKSAVSQSDDLTQWQTSAGAVVAGMTPSGVLNTYGVVASGAGLRLSQATPAVTTDTLYNAGGSLYFNGSEVGVEASAEATYASGQALSLTHASGLTVTNATDIVATSGIANYASGQAILNEADIVTTTAVANYASGEALSLNAASGQVATNTASISTNTSNIATNADNIVATSGIANYASGLAITNESQVAYASGQAIENEGLVTYASGNTANIAFGGDVGGDILYHNGTSFTRLAKGTNDYVLTMSGNVPNWEASSGGGGGGDVTTAQLNYVSGIAVYGSGQAQSLGYASGVATYASGQAIENEGDIVAVSGIANYASGQAIANEADIVSTVAVANYASGEALSLNAASGQAVYASGQAIANESDIVATSGIANYASGQAIANEADIVSTVAVANYASGEALSLNAASGQAVYASGQAIANEADIATNSARVTYASGLAISNESQVAYASGQAIANESDIVATSGIAAYASGQALSLTHASGLTATNATNITAATNTANYASGQALSLTYASGLTATNASNISTNTTNIATNAADIVTASGALRASINTNVTNISTNATDIVATSGIANYASGQALSLTHASGLTATNATNITAATNTANYASGQALSLTHASGLTATNAANITATTAVANYASGEAVSLNYASGVAAYASGQAIENEGVLSGGVPTFSGILFVDNDINIGLNAGGNGAQGDYSVNVGEFAGYEATGDYSVNIGREAGRGADADRTVNIGPEAGEGVETNYAVSIGYYANKTTDGTVFGTAVGYSAGNSCSNMGAGLLDATAIGHAAGHNNDNTKYCTFIGGRAGHSANTSSNTIGIGYQTLASASGCDDTIAMGSYAGFATWDADDCLFLGSSAGRALVVGTSSHTYNIAIGQQSFYQASGDNNICVGKYAGRSLKGSNNIEIVTAGASTSFLATSDGVADKLHIQNTIAGDTSAHKIAIGAVVAADLSPDATLEIIPAAATDVSLIARGAVSQSADLTSWQTSAGGVVAAMTPSGTLNAYGIVASGNAEFQSRVGIGTSSPSYPLEVVAHSGTVMCSGVRGGYATKTAAASVVFDIDESTVHNIELAHNPTTVAVANTRAGDKFILRLLQDSGGGNAVTWFSTIKWAGGSAPTLTATGSKADVVGFLCTGTNTYDGFVIGQDI